MHNMAWSGAIAGHNARAWQIVAAAALALTMAACGSDSATSTASDSSGSKDSVADVPLADAATADVAQPDTASKCGTLPACLNAQGQDDLSLCPKPVSDYECVAGCCSVKFVCEKNADCVTKNGVAPGCPDKAFTCGCDPDSGQCIQTMCGADADCDKGLVCSQGGCVAALVDTSLSARLLRPVWITVPGATLAAASGLGAQAVDKLGNVKPDAAFEWTLVASDAFTLADQTLTAGTKAGATTITAKVKGASTGASKPATLWNLGAIADGKNLRVTAIDELSWLPVKGKVVVIGLADAATPEAAQVVDITNGQASFAGVKFPADIHVVATDHAAVSVLRYDPAGKTADLLLPTPLHHYAELTFDAAGKVVPAETTVIHGDAVRGEVNYPGIGEAALGLTALAFDSQLLNFSVDSILGPNVKRPFDAQAPSMINPDPGKPQQIPGGVTFTLGKPVVNQYIMAGPPGAHTQWTLAGRLSLTTVISEMGKILSAVDGGIDIGRVVSVLLPYLAGFRSHVQFDVMLGETMADPIKDLVTIEPTYPLLIKTLVTVPPLPKTATGWADVAFVIGGALLPIGEIVPLGLTAGSDSSVAEDVADGVVDADYKTPGAEPLSLSVGPLHSGLRYGTENHVLVTAAIVLGGKGKKEGGSLTISAPAAVPAESKPAAFMDLPIGSTFVPDTATLTVKSVTGAMAYRLNLQGDNGLKWLVVLPKEQADKPLVLPDLSSYGAEMVASKAKRAYVAAFEFSKAMDVVGLTAPGGALSDLVRLVTRTAFTDAMP